MKIDNDNTKITTEKSIPNKEDIQPIRNPIDVLKEPFEKSLIKIEKKAKNANFMEDIYLDKSSEYLEPTKNKSMVEIANSIFSYKKLDKTIRFNKKTNYVVLSAFEVIKKYNNKSSRPDETYYIIDVVTDKGKEIKNIEIKGKAKSNADCYQETLCSANNYLQNMFKDKGEFTTFLETFILSKFYRKLIIFENSGLIKPQIFLGSDFLIEKGIIHYANSNGMIPTSDPNLFVMANNKRPYSLPQISKSTKPVEQISKDFLVNTKECYGKNGVSALLTIGHLVSGLFFRYFLKKKIGVPLLIICGVSSSGKTTLIQCGISIFGMNDDFLIAGDSTVNGQQYIAQSINDVACPVDDVYDAVLKSGNFKAKIKANYRGTPKVRMKQFGQEPDLVQICSQIIYTANGALPEVAEIENRANVITLMDTSFDVDNYNYLDENIENREELSRLLPELLKYNPDEVINKYKELKETLKNSFDTKVNNRILSNISYMWTGLKLLQEIANYTLDNIEDEIKKYAKEIVEHYKKLPTPIDMFLAGLLVMKNLGVIEKGKQYDIKNNYETEDGSILLIFHKETLLTAYNNFFSREPERKIEQSIFDKHLANDKRVFNKNFSHRYMQDNNKKGKTTGSILLNITKWAEVEEFTDTYVSNVSYADISALTKNVITCN